MGSFHITTDTLIDLLDFNRPTLHMLLYRSISLRWLQITE